MVLMEEVTVVSSVLASTPSINMQHTLATNAFVASWIDTGAMHFLQV